MGTPFYVQLYRKQSLFFTSTGVGSQQHFRELEGELVTPFHTLYIFFTAYPVQHMLLHMYIVVIIFLYIF
jgi:hypothetical protein